MARRFRPLPPEVFPVEARPHIVSLNNQLQDLFALEGMLLGSVNDTRRSDLSIARRVDPAVDITRVTPTPASATSGASVTIGTPALTLSTTNAAGSTTTVVSVNSQIAIFGTATPAGISTAGAVGTSAYAARADHVHSLADDITTQRVLVALNSGSAVGARREINFIEGSSIALTIADDPAGNQVDVTIGFSGTVAGGGGDNVQVNGVSVTNANFNDSAPTSGTSGVLVLWGVSTASPDQVSAYAPTALYTGTLSTIAAQGTSAYLLRSDSQLPVFDGTNPATLGTALSATPGVIAKAARRDHRHALDIIDDGVPISNLSNTSASGTDAFLSRTDHTHKSETNGDWYASGTTHGMITKDVQTTPRYWRIRVQGATTTCTGGCTISISSVGVITTTRDAGASGDLVIRLDDFGTAAP